MRLELDTRFLREIGLELDREDLRLGVSLGLVSPTVAIEIAIVGTRQGNTDPTLAELAQLDRDDVAGLRDLLRTSEPGDAELFPPSSVRKWTYLQLKAAFELRDRLKDPLGVVEQIYAGFDYPAAVAPFVRYMPPPAGAAVGESALYDRWSQYLASEAAELIPGSKR